MKCTRLGLPIHRLIPRHRPRWPRLATPAPRLQSLFYSNASGEFWAVQCCKDRTRKCRLGRVLLKRRPANAAVACRRAPLGSSSAVDTLPIAERDLHALR